MNRKEDRMGRGWDGLLRFAGRICWLEEDLVDRGVTYKMPP